MYSVAKIDRYRRQFLGRAGLLAFQAVALFLLQWAGVLIVAAQQQPDTFDLRPILITSLSFGDGISVLAITVGLLVALSVLVRDTVDSPQEYARVNVLVGAARVTGVIAVYVALSALVDSPRGWVKYVALITLAFVIVVFVLDAEARLDSKVEARLRTRAIKRELVRLRRAQRQWGRPDSNAAIRWLVLKSIAEAIAFVLAAALPVVAVRAAGFESIPLVAVLTLIAAIGLNATIVLVLGVIAEHLKATRRIVRFVFLRVVTGFLALTFVVFGLLSDLERGLSWGSTVWLWPTVLPFVWAATSLRRNSWPDSVHRWVQLWVWLRIRGLTRSISVLNQTGMFEVEARILRLANAL